MGAPLVLAAAAEALTWALRSTPALMAAVSNRIYPDANGDVPERPAYPFISVETAGGSETPLHTMGPDEGQKWGGLARVRVRVASQTRSDAEANTLTSQIKERLDGQRVILAGFGACDVTFEPPFQPIKDVIAGVVTREWVSEYEVLAHQ